MIVKKAPEKTPAIDAAVVEKLKDAGVYDLIVDLYQVSQRETPEKRLAQYQWRVADRVQHLVQQRDDLRDRLMIGADDLGDLCDDVPVSKHERMWLGWLAEYEALSLVIAVADEVRLGKAIVWEAADDRDA